MHPMCSQVSICFQQQHHLTVQEISIGLRLFPAMSLKEGYAGAYRVVTQPLAHLLAILGQDEAVAHQALECRFLKQGCRQHHQSVEPASCLVNACIYICCHSISFHFSAFHFIPSHFTAFDFISFHCIAFHLTMSCHATSLHFFNIISLISFPFASFHSISLHFFSLHLI